MLKKLHKTKQQGFTIIEVMIVLAIAGLILLIVLLAVPALQRNSRNTAIKNDASAVAGGVGDFATNNDGAIPTKTKSSYASGVLTLNDGSGSDTEVKLQKSTTVNIGTDKTAATITPAAGELDITFGTKCDKANGTDKYDIVVSGRSTSVVYLVETSKGTTPKCLDS